MSSKVITEAAVRKAVKTGNGSSYRVPSGKILSPAAREYLSQQKLDIIYEETEVRTKPEHMTHLDGETLVPKNHPRIVFRGKLDSLQARIILTQTLLAEEGKWEKLIRELDDIIAVLMNVMRADVCGEEMPEVQLLGLTQAELREHSHNPEKFYQIRQMIMPNYRMGKAYALLNRLRTAVRETEIAAVDAHREGDDGGRKDLETVLNRLSSAMHIMMCRMLAKYYDE